MARPRKIRNDRDTRLMALEGEIRPARDGEDDIAVSELLDQLDEEGRALVSRWMEALSAPDGSAAAAQVCCKQHAVFRLYRWMKPALAGQRFTAADLNRLDEQALDCSSDL